MVVVAVVFSRQVPKLDDCIGSEVEAHIASMANGDVVLLENVRFHGDEEVCVAWFAFLFLVFSFGGGGGEHRWTLFHDLFISPAPSKFLLLLNRSIDRPCTASWNLAFVLAPYEEQFYLRARILFCFVVCVVRDCRISFVFTQ